ncbi:hypothetical protein Ahy_A01g004704 [Arachis hypogaea]|uniref:Uncharacterized protein n=1 Tax=Arachis hypogaea TaxID=3818 RepID=A0A445EWZ2_ARAHY|nr:hypothetical protein Ahy_A01g004704 [Arachis hypogaea]
MASTSRLLLHASLPPPTTSISKTNSGSHAVIRSIWHNNGKYPKEKTCIETPLLLQHNQKHHYTCDQIKRKHFVKATHAQSKNEPEPQADSAKPIWNSIKDVMHTIQKFSVFYALIGLINKPYRPLASSKISFGGGLAIVAASLFMLPFLRWKKSTILTLLSGVPTILTAYNLAPYLHMKDIPDIEGDKKEGLQTLSIRLGPKRVFWLCISLLEMTYGIAIIMGLTSPFLWSKIFTVMAHAINAWILWFRANSVDLKSKEDFQSFYMFIFKVNDNFIQ